MKLWLFFLLTIVNFTMAQVLCPQPIKFYIECGLTRTASAAIQFCNSHQMSLVNLSNSTGTLASDIAVLNNSFVSNNCSGNFWFSWGNQTGLVANVNDLGGLLSGLLGGVLLPVVCGLLPICPTTTTAAPIINAFTVCTRPIQQRVTQKCSIQSVRSDVKEYQFNPQSLRAGLLDSFSARSRSVCSGLCSSDNTCIGTLYNNDTCILYM
jgi:hypothetical protein